ncbi:MAG: chorismate mutase [Elusimicrobiota bacterium]
MKPNIRKKLNAIRTGIDSADNGIIELLGKRRALVIRLARIKKQLNIPIYDRKREQALVDRIKKLGKRKKLNEEFAEVLFRLIMMNSKETQYHEAF